MCVYISILKFCQVASDLWGTERLERTVFALPGLLDASWVSPGAPSCALGPLWACLARRTVLFGRLLDALGCATWPLNCQTAVQKPCQVAQSACQASLQACRTLKKNKKNAVLSSNFEVRAVLHFRRCLARTLGQFGRSWGQIEGNLAILGINLAALGANLAALGTNLGALGANLDAFGAK